MTTIQERVEAGAKWLDANRPGWVDRINLETLALTDACNCVLGQEYGNYWESVDDNAVSGVGDPKSAVEMGFAESGGAGYWARYDELTDAWRDYITARRAAA